MQAGDDEALPHWVAQQQPGIAHFSAFPFFAMTGMGVFPP
jgi:hypothetical protein